MTNLAEPQQLSPQGEELKRTIGQKLFRQAKALAGVAVVIGTNVLVFVTGNEAFSDVTTAEWVTVGIQTLGVYFGVYGMTNGE